MILDELLVAVASIIILMVEGIISAAVLLINFFAFLIEAIVGLFIVGFELGRITRPERDQSGDSGQDRPAPGQTWVSPRTSLTLFFLTLIIFVGILAAPRIIYREITLLAEDGHTLPFAGVIIHTHGGDHHERTDIAGKVDIPRFTTTALKVHDPRYLAKTWQKSEIARELTVGRTILGSSLDVFSDRLLKPAWDKAKDKATEKAKD